MRNDARAPELRSGRSTKRWMVPKPSPQFRRRAWTEFQRALDPLAPVKPLQSQRQR